MLSGKNLRWSLNKRNNRSFLDILKARTVLNMRYSIKVEELMFQL